MNKANKDTADRFTFHYGYYVHGNGIYILAVEDGEDYDDVTVNLAPAYTANAEKNLIYVPSSIDPAVYKQFKRQCVDEEIGTVPYGYFDSQAILVKLKPEWKSICKPL